MAKNNVCLSVMNEVARKEEKRLMRTLLFLGPLLIVCCWLIIISFHIAVMRFMENPVVTSRIGEDGHALGEYLLILLQLFWSQTQSDVVFLLVGSVVVVIAAVMKLKLFSFPFRLKEIKKFKLHS